MQSARTKAVPQQLQGRFDKLSSDTWRARYKLKPKRGNLSIGAVACVCALWTGKSLETGTTLYKWGESFSKTVAACKESEEISLSVWGRQIRQTRFAAEEQKLIDTLVNRAIRYYRERLKSMLGESEEYKMTEIKAFKGKKDQEKRKLVENQLSQARESAMDDLREKWHLNLPGILKENFSHHECLSGEWLTRDKALSRRQNVRSVRRSTSSQSLT